MEDPKRVAIQPAAPKPSATDTLVDEWAREHLTNNVISQTPGVYNEVLKAVGVLKTRLNEHVG